MTAPVVEPKPAEPGIDDNDLVHTVCCDNNRALCGLNVTTDTWWRTPPPPERECAVCKDLADLPCPRCGE